MKIVGIVCTKHKSTRFPNKNMHKIEGTPMFWHNVDILRKSEYVDKVYVATDHGPQLGYSKLHGVAVITRGVNAADPDEPIFHVIQYAYKCLPDSFDYIVVVLPNCVGHTSEDIDRAIALCHENNLREVRSYNEYGVENGILVLREDVLRQPAISAYVGAITTGGTEIHYREDLDG